MASKRPEVLLLVGMSGAGRSSSSNVFEDLGYYVIENLPADLVESVVQSNDVTETNKQLVLTIDAKDTTAQTELKQSIDKLSQSGILTRIIFLDADNETLLERYEENRRPHPMGKDSISQSIKVERELLKPIRELADQVIDTTDMNVHELRKRINEGFQDDTSSQDLKISVTSFGFKNGTPRDADIVFDVRFLPNPHWREELRASTGQSPMVRNYVLSFEDAQVFLNKIKDMVEFLLPRFISEGKSYVGIAIGCTGGKHRSVVMAEEVTKWLKGENNDAVVLHRDMKES
ncbi:RNase adapter RapZ [Acidimicrobiaceae bacterium]|nr:RNase adapter RapZ [Acidimicrobiaceae bacterium]|tara:strand:+ start:1783 stop:2649 length:867 start_codon:yes stop_codon:yes gene_type:complete